MSRIANDTALLRSIIKLLPSRIPPPCRPENLKAWKYGERASRAAVLNLKLTGLLTAFASTPDNRGGCDSIATLIDQSFLLSEAKNYKNYPAPLSPYQFQEKVLDRYCTTEKAINQLCPDPIIHRVLQGNIPLSPGAITLAESEGVFLNLLGYQIKHPRDLAEASWQLKRELNSHARRLLGPNCVVSRTKLIAIPLLVKLSPFPAHHRLFFRCNNRDRYIINKMHLSTRQKMVPLADSFEPFEEDVAYVGKEVRV